MTSRILAVDDEADILSSVRTFLEQDLDVEVVSAFSGDEGLAILGRGGIDLVLSDFRMPEMDGLEFLRRAKEVAPDVPRVLLTAYPDIELAEAALNQAKISRFLSKPIKPLKLGQVLQELLDKRLRAVQSNAAFERAGRGGRPLPP